MNGLLDLWPWALGLGNSPYFGVWFAVQECCTLINGRCSMVKDLQNLSKRRTLRAFSTGIVTVPPVRSCFLVTRRQDPTTPTVRCSEHPHTLLSKGMGDKMCGRSFASKLSASISAGFLVTAPCGKIL